MTWKELKEAIEKMPQEELEKEIHIWGRSLPLTTTSLEVATEDMYFGDIFDRQEPEFNSGLETIEDECTHLVCKKGFHYLWSE